MWLTGLVLTAPAEAACGRRVWYSLRLLRLRVADGSGRNGLPPGGAIDPFAALVDKLLADRLNVARDLNRKTINKRCWLSEPQDTLNKRCSLSEPQDTLNKRCSLSEPQGTLNKRCSGSEPQDTLKKRCSLSEPQDNQQTLLAI